MQITTKDEEVNVNVDCYLYHKDTKLNANHNGHTESNSRYLTVTYITKILN